MIKLDFSLIREKITPGKSILLTSHNNPDGDAVGSVLALYHFFYQAGYEVYALVPNPYPEFLHWMPGHENILIYEDKQAYANQLFISSEIIFSLDYNTPERMGEAGKYLRKSKALKILIDHHIDPEVDFYDHCFSNVNISSTSELAYLFMDSINPELISKDVAECIFAGILTDTGSFSYNCNFQQTFNISGALIAKGIDAARINRLIYATHTESRLRLLGYSLSKKLKVYKEFNTAIICLTRAELEKFNHQIGDTEGLVNYALSIKGIRFAALFTEREEKIRISFRSVGNFSVNDFARAHFEGGGHKNAAGGDSYISMEQTIKKFELLLSENKHVLTD
ncbi:MAG: DHH family phosphoesterase [Bacteroidales bacterium]|nr:DHH family phosphoesterase [Bacteroidales bacterium]MCF8404641.1 DHH family phosphoesterase [Bacteroidales bacterium]